MRKGRLIFRYGTMQSSKTAQAIMQAYTYELNGLHALFVKPDCENRDGKKIIKSRIGIKRECILMSELKTMSNLDHTTAIIVDESQFLTVEDVDWLASLVDNNQINVICYGLRTDFRTNLFDGSKRLMEIADKLEEIHNICACGEKAIFNARVDDSGNILTDGDSIQLGYNYVPMCRHCYTTKSFKK